MRAHHHGAPREDVTVTTAVDEFDSNGELDLDAYEADLPVIQLKQAQDDIVDLEGATTTTTTSATTATTVDIVDPQQARIEDGTTTNMPMASPVVTTAPSVTKGFGNPEWIGVVLAGPRRPTFQQLGLEAESWSSSLTSSLTSSSSSCSFDLLTANTDYDSSTYRLVSVNGKEDGVEDDFVQTKYGRLVFQAKEAENVRTGMVQVLLSKAQQEDSFGLKIGTFFGKKKITVIRGMARQSLLNVGDHVLAVNGIACHNLSSQGLAGIIVKSPEHVTLLVQTSANTAVVVVSEMADNEDDTDGVASKHDYSSSKNYLSHFTLIAMPVLLIAIAILTIFVFVPMIMEDEESMSIMQDDGLVGSGEAFDDLWNYHLR